MVKKDTDFLDILRFLNSENINQDPDLRKRFFGSLMKCDENTSELIVSLSHSYCTSFEKKFEDQYTPDISASALANFFLGKIRSYLPSQFIEDRTNCLFVVKGDLTNSIYYLGSIKGMKRLIEKIPSYFDTLKKALIESLMIKYCAHFIEQPSETPVRLIKLIGIYYEFIRNLEPSEQIPTILDEEFLKELSLCTRKGKLDSRKCLNSIENLINRKFPIGTEKIPRELC